MKKTLLTFKQLLAYYTYNNLIKFLIELIVKKTKYCRLRHHALLQFIISFFIFKIYNPKPQSLAGYK